jgi:hypothetical protein
MVIKTRFSRGDTVWYWRHSVITSGVVTATRLQDGQWFNPEGARKGPENATTVYHQVDQSVVVNEAGLYETPEEAKANARVEKKA